MLGRYLKLWRHDLFYMSEIQCCPFNSAWVTISISYPLADPDAERCALDFRNRDFWRCQLGSNLYSLIRQARYYRVIGPSVGWGWSGSLFFFSLPLPPPPTLWRPGNSSEDVELALELEPCELGPSVHAVNTFFFIHGHRRLVLI